MNTNFLNYIWENMQQIHSPNMSSELLLNKAITKIIIICITF